MPAPAPHRKLDALFDAAKRAGGRALARAPRRAAQGAIRGYQLTLSGVTGRQCRHLPSCSEYTAEAIGRFGLWAGGWMGLARICRCGPFGTHGIDNVPDVLPLRGRWYTPWAYARWRGVNGPEKDPENHPLAGEAAPDDGGAARG